MDTLANSLCAMWRGTRRRLMRRYALLLRRWKDFQPSVCFSIHKRWDEKESAAEGRTLALAKKICGRAFQLGTGVY